jgi:hypothetical protein
MLVLLASVLLLFIHQGQCAMQGTANLQLDGTTTFIGTLKFVQNDANSPVTITGTLTIPNAANTVHVCLYKRINIFMIFLLHRAFMYILQLYHKLHQIAQQL